MTLLSMMRLKAVGGAVGVAMLLAGCGAFGEEIEPEQWEYACPSAAGKPLAIVLGVRQNSPDPQLPKGIEELIFGAADAERKIVVIPVDGKPTVEAEGTFSSDAGNEVARRDDMVTFVEDLRGAMAQVKADDPEADPLSALTLAAREAGPGGTVLMLDSGLQTVDPLDFQVDGMLDSDPNEVADYLKQSNLLPDFSDRSVILGGLGDVVAPQDPLGSYRQNVIDVWRTIAEQGNAACTQVLDDPNTEEARAGLPPVSPVEVPQVDTPPVVPESEPGKQPKCEETVLHDKGNVKFNPDQATFRDPAAARDHLRQMANQIIKQNLRVHLLGTTSSWGTEEGRRQLSQERADAVKQIFVDLGVPANRITSEGVGINWDGYVEDRGPNDELLLGPAAKNRSVVVRTNC